MRQQARNYSLAMLEQTCQIVDGYLHSIDQLMTNLMIDTQIHDFLSTKAPLTSDDKYKMISIVNQISKYKNSNNLVENVYIYFKNTDSILTATAKYTPDIFYNNELLSTELTLEEWNVLHDRVVWREYIPLGSDLMTRKGEAYIGYMQSLPINEISEPSGMAVILIDAGKIVKLLQNINLNSNELVLITDDKNQLIFIKGNQDLYMDGILKKLSTSSDTYFFDKVNNNDVMVSYTLSTYNNWRYVSILPTCEMMKKVNNVSLKNVIFIIVELSLGLIIALLLAMKNYKPIRKLVNTLMQKKKLHNQHIENELSFIEEVAWKTICENENAKNEIEKQKTLLRSSFLRQLINGDVQSIQNAQEIRNALENFNVSFYYNCFCVLIVHVDSNSSSCKLDAHKSRMLKKSIIMNNLEELMNLECTTYAVNANDGKIALVLNIDGGSPETAVKIHSLAEKAKEYMLQHFSVVLSFGIGYIYTGIEGICTSYYEACKALEYRLIKGNGIIMAYHDIPYKPNKYIYPITTENEIINNLKTGNVQKVIKILDELFFHIKNDSSSSIEMVKYLIFNITSTVLKVLDNLSVNERSTLSKQYESIMKIMYSETASEIYDILKSAVINICEYINSNKKSHNEQLAEKIVEYIKDNYADSCMSLNTMAANFHLNPSYLSTFIKDYFGKNYIDIFSEVRIEKIKELLANPSLTTDEIAQKVGYANGNSLTRAFKKSTGITPGQYRQYVSKT